MTTDPATFIASFSAMLNGSLDPHGLTTSVSFQYGTTTSYGSTTPMQNQTGSTFRNVSANISGLSAHTIYHFRIIATKQRRQQVGQRQDLYHSLVPSDDRESAIARTLAPGNYTAIVRGVNNTTGVAEKRQAARRITISCSIASAIPL